MHAMTSKSKETLAAIPKSIIQASPVFPPRISILHAVKHQRAIERGLVEQGDFGPPIGEFRSPSNLLRGRWFVSAKFNIGQCRTLS